MDFGDNMFCLSNHIREENGNTTTSNNINNNSNSFAWYSWEVPSSTSSTHINAFHTAAEGSAAAVISHQQQQPPLYGGDGSNVHPDPHLTCLKLGKRHYFEDTNNTNNNVASGASLGERHVSSVGVGGGGELFALEGDKRAKGYYGSGGGGSGGEKTAAAFTAATVPRCQVEGCHVALVSAKEYHRRHKVCEMHSKAPKVVVLGREQRFCQQCSRFHAVSEFDESKRSCRRRLAGHNERRRKSSHHPVARSSTQGCALSLLSPGSNSWLSHADLSIRCSAALHELIAENRAALMARQLVLDRDWHLHHNAVEDSKEMHPESNCFPQQIFPQTQ